VPDGVDAVRVTYSDGANATARVGNNFYDIPTALDSNNGDPAPTRPVSISWLNSAGNALQTFRLMR
jgi:hypothetical protein